MFNTLIVSSKYETAFILVNFYFIWGNFELVLSVYTIKCFNIHIFLSLIYMFNL